MAAAPAIEFNVFPVLGLHAPAVRALYAVGVQHARYNEVTLFQKLKETLPTHELSVTLRAA